jgi:hypothetical protein
MVTFVPNIMTPLHLHPLFPVYSLIMSRFLYFIDTKSKFIFIAILIIFITLNLFTILTAISNWDNHDYVEKIMRGRLGMTCYTVGTKLRDAPRIVGFVNMNPRYCLAKQFYFASWGKEITPLCDIIYEESFSTEIKSVDCPHAEFLLNSSLRDEEMRYLFENKTISEFPAPWEIFWNYTFKKNISIEIEDIVTDSRGNPKYYIFKRTM